MPITPELSHKLKEVLGDEAALELVGFMDRVDAERVGLRHVNDLYLSRLDARLDVRLAEAQAASQADLAALKLDVRADLAALNAELQDEIGKARVGLEAQIATLREDMNTALTGVNATLAGMREDMGRMEGRFEAIVERRFSDLVKWSFMFWVGAVAAVALLAGVLG